MTEIFVFGSNLAGRHGKGAALTARQMHGAIYGRGVGRQGASYAIATKDEDLRTLPLRDISIFVMEFLAYARANPDLTFNVTAIGTGLAGYRHDQIAPMFAGAPKNCIMPEAWAGLIETRFKPYRRKQIAELRPWKPGESMDRVSISAPDREAGSPKIGDMIARNPKNHDDQWLVAAKYFADNFEPMGDSDV